MCLPGQPPADCARALAAVLVPGTAPELALAHRWLDNWRGVGRITEGMHRAGWDLQLTE
jgi:hypothetical protein